MWTTPKLAPPLLTTTPHQRNDVSALDIYNVHRCPTRRVFSGTGLEHLTRQATIRYRYHSATAATVVPLKARREEEMVHVKYVEAQTSSLWHGVVIRRCSASSGKEGKLPEPETGWTSRCTPIVDRSLEHHTGDSTIFFSLAPPQFRGEHPGVGGQEPSPLFPFHQPHERTCGLKAI
ncbi:uncharacterized protein TNCV_4291491 [Trichonephila clavipes]|nr:uncharacterized protein TNCV_4291491 [Trichonephila clavipes]